MQELIDFSHHLADTAGTIIRQYYRQPFSVDYKSEEQPVTVADRAAEEALRALIEKHCPDDGIQGEEFGIKQGRSNRIWVLDPIDGTKSFIVGRPNFGTLIALCEDNIPVLGVIDHPALGERWIGARDMPTTFNGAPVRVRACQSLKKACLGSTDPLLFPGGLKGEKLAAAPVFMVWGGDCYLYGQVASGTLDGVAERGLAPHDLAALVPVICGAGGIMTDWEGKALTLKSDGRVIAAGDVRVHAEILSLLEKEK